MSSDFAAEFGFGGHALELGFFERPVFDAESFGAGQRDIVVELAKCCDCSGRRACG